MFFSERIIGGLIIMGIHQIVFISSTKTHEEDCFYKDFLCIVQMPKVNILNHKSHLPQINRKGYL